MIENTLQQLFQQYLSAFRVYDLAGVTDCYHIPCTLNTPDNLVLIDSEEKCQQEFLAIFEQLKQANTQKIVAQKVSYQAMTPSVSLVCIDWVFFDNNEQIFADFSAVYHVESVGSSHKIINVASHDLTHSLNLAHSFTLS
ncbi:ketosteroid isomerase family protein [Litorilituus lipolyticus]|uniref:Uncharacterized protein n=1 Tax=Litorilituus lipolyticus TaxID=2491017 RepID=A0A502KY96_9GAMM|nr:ketosteroid isomerase family protein [Litorilituus lipolyticus]TPH14633.1 hypothetical protein EPA86_11075 [Litorilituus lipolyticus]